MVLISHILLVSWGSGVFQKINYGITSITFDSSVFYGITVSMIFCWRVSYIYFIRGHMDDKLTVSSDTTIYFHEYYTIFVMLGYC